ncbi:DUF2637 domain-containing protein [Phytomonospora sp. NPDC050363]|uniref:DUF2637 domain-containing protein n=1 Tax=Phytomonospora sp. NPDC050363 TaxID=3155642 RepID=UPI0033DC759C
MSIDWNSGLQPDGTLWGFSPWAWGPALAALLIFVFWLYRKTKKRAHIRLEQIKATKTGKGSTPADKANDGRVLFAFAVAVAFSVWGAVLVASLSGLVGFGEDTLGWKNGMAYVVPATLDGVSVVSALLSFVAVRRRRDPSKFLKYTWGIALLSAFINGVHMFGETGSLVAGLYLAGLSILAVALIHSFLDLFTQGVEYIEDKRRTPKFGQRWIWALPSTLMALRNWHINPPVPGRYEANPRDALTWYAHCKAIKARAKHISDLTKATRAKVLQDAKAELATPPPPAITAPEAPVPAAIPHTLPLAPEPFTEPAPPTRTVPQPHLNGFHNGLPVQRVNGEAPRGTEATDETMPKENTVLERLKLWNDICEHAAAALDPAGNPRTPQRPHDFIRSLDEDTAKLVFKKSKRTLHNLGKDVTDGVLDYQAAHYKLPVPDSIPRIETVTA